jgi:(p)ppGpp synthase/HD superfamily hydrolase
LLYSTQAINLASRLHSSQVRKGDINLPYISHPFSVAWILSNYTDDEDVIISGLLHDILEGVKGYYYEDLKRDFGTKVAEIVKGVSEDKDPNVESDKKATWEDRKTKYLAGLDNDSNESLMVCAADKIHNLQSMINAYQEKGEALWDSFNSPKDKKLWLYEEIAKTLQKRLNSPIVSELEAVYREAERILIK